MAVSPNELKVFYLSICYVYVYFSFYYLNMINYWKKIIISFMKKEYEYENSIIF